MLAIALVGCLLGADSAPSAETRTAYETQRKETGREASAQVRLALWCESQGLTTERSEHLAQALLVEPNNETARALLGHVRIDGRWSDPSEVAEQVQADAELSARLAEYQARRERLTPTAEAHWKLALWCERNGLGPEAEAHFSRVVQLEPAHEAAWKRLGCVRFDGRWLPRAEAEAARAESRTAHHADSLWQHRLATSKDRLDRGALVDATLRELTGIVDPHAVPAIWRLFALGSERDQARAVVLLGQIEGLAASRALALLAVFPDDATVRRTAAETLASRDPREALTPLVEMLRDPIRFDGTPVGGPGEAGTLLVEGPRAFTLRVYAPPALPWLTQMPGTFGGVDANGDRLTSADIRQDLLAVAAVAQRQWLDDLRSLFLQNAAIAQQNARAGQVLANLSSEQLGADPERWRGWWSDQLGYSYRKDDRRKPMVVVDVSIQAQARTFARVDSYVMPLSSCFAAGTPVVTKVGTRPIESLEVGDVVLAQEPATGRLGYAPVTAVHHNPPALTLRIAFDQGEPIVATPIHRFWKAGTGWVMARDLKPGDTLRRLGGVTRVERIEPDGIQAVFNLDVAGTRTFLVGEAGLLVHDHTLVQPPGRAFDAHQAFVAAATE